MGGNSLAGLIRQRRQELNKAIGHYKLLRRSLGDVNRLRSPMRRMFQAGHLGALRHWRSVALTLMIQLRIDLINYQTIKGMRS